MQTLYQHSTGLQWTGYLQQPQGLVVHPGLQAHVLVGHGSGWAPSLALAQATC